MNKTMNRFILTLTLLIAATAAAAQTAERPRLRAETVVRGDVVRIGDVIDNAGVVASIAIFRAPDLGETGNVSTASIVDAVRAHAIVGLDTDGLQEVKVTRASRTIAAKDVEREIARSLAAQYSLGDSRALSVTFDRELRAMQVEPSTRSELRIGRLAYDTRSGRFDATFDFAGMRPIRLTGTAIVTVETVALVNPVARGQVIKATDVAIERRPKSEAVAGLLNASDTTIGMAVRQALRPGQALRATDLMKPELVQRDAAVTLVYEMPGVMLTVRGKAAEGGAEGDVISVINLQSKRSVQGIITGAGRVLVSSPMPPRVVANVDPSMLSPVLSNELGRSE